MYYIIIYVLYIYIYIYIYIYVFTFLYEVHFHINCFVCFFIYYICDGSMASIASPIISLVTGKNEYEINALRKKASITFKQKI